MRKGCAGHLQIVILFQFLAIKPHFVRKGCAGRQKLQFYFGFWRSNFVSCQRVALDMQIAILPQFSAIELHFVCARKHEIAILLQFLAIEHHFVRKGCISCRLVGTAPCLQERNRKEGESKRAREQEGKRARLRARENVKM